MASPKGYRCHVTSTLQLWGGQWRVGRKGKASSAEEYRTEEGESLPLTGPMYIISEARMKTERVRERNTGKRWREEAKWEQTTSRGQI